MAQRQAEIKFVVDAKGAIKPMVKVEDGLKDISELSEKTQKDLREAFRGAAKGGRQAAAGTKQASSGMQQMAGSTRTANQTMFQFGQIAEDSAFGIRGVANNITPAVQGFQRLQSETGGAGSAAKALLSSLAGPAGIIVAFQTMSTLALVLGPRIKKMFDDAADGAQLTESAIDDALGQLIEFKREAQSFTIPVENVRPILNEVNRQLAELRGQLSEDASRRSALFGTMQAGGQQAVNLMSQSNTLSEKQKEHLNDQILARQQLAGQLRQQLLLTKALGAAQQATREAGVMSDDLRNFLLDSLLKVHEPLEKQKETEEEINLTLKQRLGMTQAWFEHLTKTYQAAQNVSDAMELPPDPMKEQVDSFDQAILRLAEFRRVQEAGLISGQAAARHQVSLLRQSLIRLVKEGLDPASEEYKALLDRLKDAEQDLEATKDQASASADVMGNELIPMADQLGRTLVDAFGKGKDAGEQFKRVLAEIAGLLTKEVVREGLKALRDSGDDGDSESSSEDGIDWGSIITSGLAAAAAVGVKALLAADGGRVVGPGGPRDDRVPALLSNGEHVINAKSTANAPNLTRALNNSPAFAKRMERVAVGGPVGNIREMPTPSVRLNNDQVVSAIRSMERSMSKRIENQTRRLEQVERSVDVSRVHDELEKESYRRTRIGRGGS